MSHKPLIGQHKWAIVLFSIVGLIVVFFLILLTVHVLQPRFPSNVRKEADFTLFYPVRGASGVTPIRSTISYDASEGGVAYTTIVDGARVIISMQATPQIFAEGPVYNYKLQQSHEFASFQTRLGEITLTKPGGLNGQVVAVGDSQGTLVFAHAFSSLTTDGWKQLFNSLETVNG